VEKRFLFVAKDADVHGSGMKVDSAVVPVLFGVESHWASSFGSKMVDVAISILLRLWRRP
jgi:hypothetical protein